MHKPELRQLWQMLLSFIDWLNLKVGAEKPKNKSKQPAEPMVPLSDLFEGYDDLFGVPDDFVAELNYNIVVAAVTGQECKHQS